MPRCPDKYWEQILNGMIRVMRNVHGNSASDALVATFEESNDAMECQQAMHRGARSQLAAVIFLSGHLALRMLVFLEEVQSALKKKRLSEEDKRMAEEREKKKEKQQQKKKGKRGSK